MQCKLWRSKGVRGEVGNTLRTQILYQHCGVIFIQSEFSNVSSNCLHEQVTFVESIWFFPKVTFQMSPQLKFNIWIYQLFWGELLLSLRCLSYWQETSFVFSHCINVFFRFTPRHWKKHDDERLSYNSFVRLIQQGFVSSRKSNLVVSSINNIIKALTQRKMFFVFRALLQKWQFEIPQKFILQYC